MSEQEIERWAGDTPGVSFPAHSVRQPHDGKTFFRRPDTLADPLYVVTTIFDPHRFRSRWKLYQDFKYMVAHSGAVLYVAEIAYGAREFVITTPDNPRHLQLRTSHDFWAKENALNLLVQRLPHDWKYVAWIDADCAFARSDWADETRHKLQHHPIVQCWSEAQDLSPDHEVLQKHVSLAHCFTSGMPVPPMSEPPYYYGLPKKKITYWHPGYAHACTREMWNAMGGLIDYAPLGSADAHMAYSLIGRVESTIHHDLHDRYKYMLRLWAQRAEAACKRNLGCVRGLLNHHWHGPKKARKYVSRWKILIEEGFNPDTHLYRDSQGLYQLSDYDPRMWNFRNRVREYMSQRQEDDIRVD